MKIIQLDGKAYKVTEEQFLLLKSKEAEIYGKPYYNSQDVEMADFIKSLKPQFKCLGYIEFSFQL
jgi:hypothetical protein